MFEMQAVRGVLHFAKMLAQHKHLMNGHFSVTQQRQQIRRPFAVDMFKLIKQVQDNAKDDVPVESKPEVDHSVVPHPCTVPNAIESDDQLQEEWKELERRVIKRPTKQKGA